MANTEIDPFAYNPAAAASVFGALPPQAAPEEVDISQYLPQAATQAQPMQGRSSSYDEAFQQAESQYGLPSGLLSTIGFHESRFNPNAVSPAGAEGLMQLMPPTAREYGVNARDPYASIDAAGKKMAGLVKYYNGDMAKAVAAYNYGEGNLN
jgi:soluble lytic murein transglycosylase-like protein